jgi:hypothetical protein
MIYQDMPRRCRRMNVITPSPAITMGTADIMAFWPTKGGTVVSKKQRFIWVIAVLLAAGAPAGPLMAADAVEKEGNLAAGEPETKELLLLMDRDQNGKVSRQEFMNFMEGEFDRLDKNKDGELDVEELTQLRVHGFRAGPHK